MNQLVFKGENNQALTTSLLVSERFGKNHFHVLRDIENLSCSKEFRASNFGLSSYKNQQNKELPMYIMTKDGFTFLVMGYTGETAGKFKEDFISAFNQMEQQIRTGGFQVPSSFREALLLAANLQGQVEESQKLIEEMKPKTVFADAVTGSNTNILIRDLAKYITQNGFVIGEENLYNWLVGKKYLIRNRRWSKTKQRWMNDYMPTQSAAEMKVFYVTEQAISVGDSTFIKHTVKITGKGQIFFLNKFMQQVGGLIHANQL